MKQFTVDTGGTLTTGLLSYYKLNSDSTDFFGAVNGTDTAVTYVAGKVGNAGDFVPANSSKIDFGNNFAFERTDSFSIAGWIFVDALDANNRNIFAKAAVTTSRGYWLRMQTPDGKAQVVLANNIGGEFINVVSTTLFGTGAWHHIVVTYNGNSSNTGVKIYKNGTEVTYTTKAGTLTTTMVTADAFMFGKGGNWSTDFLDGQMDEFGVWNKVLSAQEITDLYNGGSGQTMTETTAFTPQVMIF